MTNGPTIEFPNSPNPDINLHGSTLGGAEIESPVLPGVDPDTQDALMNDDDEARKRLRKLGDNAQTADDAQNKFGDDDKKIGKDAEGVDTNDILKNLLGGFSSAMGQGQMPSMPSLPQIPMDQFAGTSQDQLDGAGNREDLIKALLNATRNDDGSLSYQGNLMGNGFSPIGINGEGGEAQLQELANQLVAAGIPYAYGGGTLEGPSNGQYGLNSTADAMGDHNKQGFDCSSLMRYMLYQVYGVEIPRTSEAQYAASTPISASEARPGDLYFQTSARRPPGHVQMYMGGDTVIEAPSSGQFVSFNTLTPGEFRRAL